MIDPGSFRWALLLGCAATAGCMVGPDYHRVKVENPSRFKEARPLPGWEVANPANAAMPKGKWWTIYGDNVLDDLEDQVAVSNQSLKASEANYRQAVALVDEARGQLFPVLGLTPSIQRSGSGGTSVNVGTGSGLTGTGSSVSTSSTTTGTTSSATTSLPTSISTGGTSRSSLTVEGTVSWDLDLWGRIRRQIESSVSTAQADAAEIANAQLSLQATLATDYFEMRSADSLQKLLDQTVRVYQHDVEVVGNQTRAGTVLPSSYYQALTQLQQTQASAASVGASRAEYEHAIAVLTGHAPADVAIAPGDLQAYVPQVDAGIPSTLLQRRPDIAEAERQVEAANAEIGVEIAAFYPDISLTASGGYVGPQLSTLFNLANQFWSLGVAASQTLFEGGIRTAAVEAARASYDASVANYRETVLTAFEGVEDELAFLRFYGQQATYQRQAVESAYKTVTISFNEYQAGTEDYTTVVTAQATALGDAQSALTVQQNLLTASVALIEALGGGFSTDQLPSKGSLQTSDPFIPAFLEK
jgi:NodT family efflux transporter outer membrane factor (OMF) lipoprotein